MVASNSAWYDATDEERHNLILPRFKAILDELDAQGARVIGSFDDDLFVVGPPTSVGYSIYILYEVDDVSKVVQMLQSLRETVDGVRLDRYIRMEARVGRPLFFFANQNGQNGHNGDWPS
jgi:hypothetical protein